MDGDFTSDWVTWHEADWRRWLESFRGRENTTVLEIGSYEGRSACWFCDEILTGNGSYCVCVDGWWSAEREARFDSNTKGKPVHKLRGTSREILAKLTTEGRRYSIGYVDGDHSAAETLADLCGVWYLLSPGGVLIADDYGWTSPERPIPPKPAIDSFLACYADRIDRYEISKCHQAVIWKP